MSKSLLNFVMILVIIGAAWWVWHEMSDSAVEVEIGTNQTATTSPEEFVEIETTDVNIYRNEDWGFQFEYPADWEIREPAFGSSVSLFNMAIEPVDPYNLHAILVNITPKSWIESENVKMKARGVVISEVEFKNRTALFVVNDQGIGGPTENYYILISDEYWIHLSGQVRQKDAFVDFLNSFEFIE